MATVVTRFAPSPTGYLHVGGARTALFSWLLARHHGENGRFLLRIEDTDLARSTEQAMLQLLEDLRWLGLAWDNAELVYQSKRQAIYNKLIEDLIARDLAYLAYETPEELDALRKEAEKQKRTFLYRRRRYTPEEMDRFERENRKAVVRFAMPVKPYSFQDVVLGKEIALPAEEAQDFVIRKTDGMPTYHFAVVVDDAEMNITHVLRGQEHTKNTFLHIAIQEALGYPRPIYGHLPVIENMGGGKMGKRDRDKKIRESAQIWMKTHKRPVADIASAASLDEPRIDQWIKDSKKQLDIPEQQAVMQVVGLKESDLPEILVHDFRKNGYLPEALLNFLALLGWSPGGDRERMSIEEMIAEFSLERVNAGSAKFDRAKLLAFNTEACAAAPTDRLVRAMRDYLSVNPDSPLSGATDEQLAALIDMKRGFRTLREVDEISRFFFIADASMGYDRDAIEKVLLKNDQQGLNALRDLKDVLGGVGDWTKEPLESAVKQYAESKQLGLGKVAQPLRVAICGTTVSPAIFESLAFLGRERTMNRINRCLAAAS